MLSPSVILRLEAVAIAVAGIVAYVLMNGDPWWLLPLLLAPDVSMLGYAAGPRVGALTYNVVHNHALALVLLAVGWAAGMAPVALAGAVLIAHVGMDRAFGYGLKLPSGFKDTHLGRIGR